LGDITRSSSLLTCLSSTSLASLPIPPIFLCLLLSPLFCDGCLDSWFSELLPGGHSHGSENLSALVS
jgi:hypothetical protein